MQADKYPLDKGFSQKEKSLGEKKGCKCVRLRVCNEKKCECLKLSTKKNFTGTTGLSGQKQREQLKPIRVSRKPFPRPQCSNGLNEERFLFKCSCHSESRCVKGGTGLQADGMH